MIELPEALTLGQQISKTLAGKTITEVFNANSPHKFTFFYNDPLTYKQLLTGKRIESAKGTGIFVDISLNDDIKISVNDGVNLRYGDQSSSIPEKYQLLLTFNDHTFLAFTVAMYGGISAYKGRLDNKYHDKSAESISPLGEEFDMACFENLIGKEKKNLSLKALLATKQRIPGIGNGVLQDILFNASLNPKRKISDLTDTDKENLFQSLKATLTDMTANGGRDTETDLFGNRGGYKAIMSKNTYAQPCPKCNGAIRKESYMGGAVYYCPNCQPI
ncbi:MAG: endonuclease VIII [Mangrovibacterium sp.]